MEFLVLGLVAGIGFASYALWSQLREEQGAPPKRNDEGKDEPKAPRALPPPAERTPMTIQVGDVVQHLGTDYLVEGVLTLSEEGRGARLYRMMDGAAERYLYVEPPPAEPLLLQRVGGEAPAGEPDELVHGERTYRVRRRALVAAIGVGSFGDQPVKDRARLLLYGGAAGARLLILDWAGRGELYAGERVLAHALELLPGR
jgi:hypothetical protein